MALAVMSLAAHARAQAPAVAAPQNTVTLNPVRYGLLHFQIEYERVLNDDVTLFLSPIAFHHATWYPFNKIAGTTGEGLGLDIGARWYFFGDAPSGFHAGPLLSAYYAVEHRDGVDLAGLVFSPGAQVGYQAVLWDWLVLGAGAGGSYGFGTSAPPAGSPTGAGLPHSGFWVNFRSNVGVAF